MLVGEWSQTSCRPIQDYEQQFFMLKVFVIGGIGTVLGTLVRL